MRRKPTTRAEARDLIIREANLQQLRRSRGRFKLLTARHLQQAVCVVRRRRLVSPAVLELAGFNPTERRR